MLCMGFALASSRRGGCGKRESGLDPGLLGLGPAAQECPAARYFCPRIDQERAFFPFQPSSPKHCYYAPLPPLPTTSLPPSLDPGKKASTSAKSSRLSLSLCFAAGLRLGEDDSE